MKSAKAQLYAIAIALAIAGIWESWKNPAGESVHTQ